MYKGIPLHYTCQWHQLSFDAHHKRFDLEVAGAFLKNACLPYVCTVFYEKCAGRWCHSQLQVTIACRFLQDKTKLRSDNCHSNVSLWDWTVESRFVIFVTYWPSKCLHILNTGVKKWWCHSRLAPANCEKSPTANTLILDYKIVANS